LDKACFFWAFSQNCKNFIAELILQ